MYHFLVESKPHERIDVLITASVNIYHTKKEKKCFPIVMKTCFSEGKLKKQFGNPLSKRTPPFQLTPLFFKQFFHDLPLCPNFKKKNLGGRKLWEWISNITDKNFS